jgi:hypothetical protein
VGYSEPVAQDVDRLPLYKSALELHETSGIPYRLDLEIKSDMATRRILQLFIRPLRETQEHCVFLSFKLAEISIFENQILVSDDCKEFPAGWICSEETGQRGGFYSSS